MQKLGLLVVSAFLLASFSLPIIVQAQSCSGDNYLFSGTCKLPSQCAPANSDTSASCSSGYVCCKPGTTLNNSGNPSSGTNQTLAFYKNLVVDTINNILVPILIAIAFIVFLWGVYKYYILGATDETARRSGHQLVLWGVIGFAIIVSVWALVNIVTSVLIPSTASNTAPPAPTI